MSTLFSPTGTPPRNGAPPHLPLILCWGKLAPRHFALLRAAPFRVAVRRLRNVSLASHKIFSPCTYLVLPSAIAENRLVSSHPLEEVTLPRWHQTMGIIKMEGRRRRFEEINPAESTETTTANGDPIGIPEEAQPWSLGIIRSEVRAVLGEGRQRQQRRGGRRSRGIVGVHKSRLRLRRSSPIIPDLTQQPPSGTGHSSRRGRGGAGVRERERAWGRALARARRL